MTTDLAIRDPETRIELAESWAAMPADARKRRAAQASQEDDREELQSLLQAYVFTEGARGPDTSSQTLKTYWYGAENLLDWCASKGIKPHQLEKGSQAKVSPGRRWVASMGSLTAKSRQTYLTGARTMIQALWWAGMGNPEEDPFQGVRIQDPTPGHEKANPYSVEELNRLLEASDKRERVLVLLAADAGLRLVESVALTWGRIDGKAKKITVVGGKGGKTQSVDATPRLLAALEELRGDRERGRVFDISRRRVQQLFKRLCKRAEVEYRGYHSLRHTCGTELYRICKDLILVARHLRHSSTKPTEIYAHLADEEYSTAVAALGDRSTHPDKDRDLLPGFIQN